MRRLLGKVKVEDGAAIVLIAVSMMLIIGMAALAVDLGALRVDIRADRLAADAAATAGASSINPFTGSNAEVACDVAWAYLLLNLEDEGSPTAPDCSTEFSGTCNPLIARNATGSAGPYSFAITHPVPDGDLLMGSQAINVQIDGVSCQRLGVSIQRTRNSWFARVLGFASNSTSVSAVARINPDVGEGDVVPLVLLEPTGCDALTADGQGKITVTHFMDSPGFIVVDSDGSGSDCSPAKPYIIEVQAVGNRRWIRAIPTPAPTRIPSAILSYALSGVAGTDPTRAYNPADLETDIVGADPADPPESYFQLFPQPGPRSQRVTRAPIDWRYNCQGVYPPYLGLTIDPCPNTPATYIDDLRSLLEGPLGPVGFTRWTDTYPCTIGAGIVTVSGDWWVNCPDFIVNGATVIFNDGDVVFNGNVDIRSTGVLEVNPSPSDEFDNHIVFVRDGDLKNGAQTRVSLIQTFVYLRNGTIDLVGETVLDWTAPKRGNFEDLALWSESSDSHELGGQGGNTLTGTFFTPYADPFILKGQSGQLQTDAQFLTRRLVVTGFTEVLMKPDPETSTLIPIRGVKLIR